MVHRILTATLENAVDKTYEVEAIAKIAEHCNEKRLAAKSAQERSDEVTASRLLLCQLYLPEFVARFRCKRLVSVTSSGLGCAFGTRHTRILSYPTWLSAVLSRFI